MGGELWDVKVLIALLLEETVGDAVVGFDGKCDVKEVDGS